MEYGMTYSVCFFDPDGNRFRTPHQLPAECASRDGCLFP